MTRGTLCVATDCPRVVICTVVTSGGFGSRRINKRDATEIAEWFAKFANLNPYLVLEHSRGESRVEVVQKGRTKRYYLRNVR